VVTSCTQVLQAQGLRGLYVGFRETLIRDVPEIAIQVRLVVAAYV